MKMKEAEHIASLIGRALPDLKQGTLRFWGVWFGRPYDNQHEILSCTAEAELLTLRFNDGEVLRVWSPRKATIDAKRFRIREADRVRWEWFYYGRPKLPANLYFEDFTLEGSQIRAQTNIDWCEPNLKTDLSLPAVEIL